jgi:2-oxo-4-hydroxy-4-carboxy-5-ureidoimidazoline decarboxylase
MADTPARELPFAWLDRLTRDEARAALGRCCASRRWVDVMLERRPFGSSERLRSAAREVWANLMRADYLEAFAGHPPIGARVSAMRERFASTHGFSREEQAGVDAADEVVLAALEQANQAYLARFGYLFIVCATGKTAPELLALLRERLPNAPDRELLVAAAEQAKITELRLEKLRP